jgi:hypothetical protein
LEIVKLINENYTGDCRFALDGGFRKAAYNDHMDVVKYLLENRRDECDVVVGFSEAVRGQNFEIARYLWGKHGQLQGHTRIEQMFLESDGIDYQFYDLLRAFLLKQCNIRIPRLKW